VSRVQSVRSGPSIKQQPDGWMQGTGGGNLLHSRWFSIYSPKEAEHSSLQVSPESLELAKARGASNLTLVSPSSRNIHPHNFGRVHRPLWLSGRSIDPPDGDGSLAFVSNLRRHSTGMKTSPRNLTTAGGLNANVNVLPH